jgi:hypothetical protein
MKLGGDNPRAGFIRPAGHPITHAVLVPQPRVARDLRR